MLIEILWKKFVMCLLHDENIFDWYFVSRECGVTNLDVLTESYIRENCTRLHWKAIQNHTKIDHVINHILVKQPFQKEIVFVISDDYSNDIHHVYLTDPQRKMWNDVRILKDLLGSAHCVLNYIHLPYFCGTSITFKGLLIILDMSLVTIWIFYMDSSRENVLIWSMPPSRKWWQIYLNKG